MQFHSTRNRQLSVSSAQAIKQGLSAEGGLFVPEFIPQMTQEEIGRLAHMNYAERAKEILARYLTDFTDEELERCISRAYRAEKFGSDQIAPVHQLCDGQYILELWHGPTCAFKDMALQILPHLLTTAMKKTGETAQVVILVATSGDTGKAALEGFCNVDGTKIIVFYPQSGVSEIQKLQMATQDGENVSVAAVVGNFDDAQNGVKKIFTDEACNRLLAENGYKFSSANSINWGRLVPQIVYYFSAYADLIKQGEIVLGEKINIVVPTGNFGNILAAYYAYCMGLPVKRFLCASNENNVLTDFIRTGIYDKNRAFYTTISPSMDILISSNLERFLYHLSGGNDILVASWMQQLQTCGKYTVDLTVKNNMQSIFSGGYADCRQTMKTIGDCYQKFGYVMDTHTAVAKAVYDEYIRQTNDTTKTVIASTASPFKFNKSVLQAIAGDEAVSGKDEFELLDSLQEITGWEIPNSLAALRQKAPRFRTVWEKDEMLSAVKDFLQLS